MILDKRDRSGGDLGSWARERGETHFGWKIWTSREVSILRRNYPNYAKIRQLLPHRSKTAIWNTAHHLQISKRRLDWTSERVARLRQLSRDGHSYRACAKIMKIERGTVWFAMRRYGIRKKLPPPGLARDPLVHAIRQRAHGFGLTPSDLQAEFDRNFWAGSHVGMTVLRKVVRMLDGRLIRDRGVSRIVWND